MPGSSGVESYEEEGFHPVIKCVGFVYILQNVAARKQDDIMSYGLQSRVGVVPA